MFVFKEDFKSRATSKPRPSQVAASPNTPQPVAILQSKTICSSNMVTFVYVENTTSHTLHLSTRHTSELPLSLSVTGGRSRANTTVTVDTVEGSNDMADAPQPDPVHPPSQAAPGDLFPQPEWKVLTTVLPPGGRARVLETAREQRILPDVAYFWDVEVTVPALEVAERRMAAVAASARNTGASSVYFEASQDLVEDGATPTDGHGDSARLPDININGVQDVHNESKPRPRSISAVSSKSNTGTRIRAPLLKLKQRVSGGSIHSRLACGVSADPHDACQPALTWHSDRKSHISQWQAYGRRFQISYRALSTLGDKDLEFVVREIMGTVLPEATRVSKEIPASPNMSATSLPRSMEVE